MKLLILLGLFIILLYITSPFLGLWLERLHKKIKRVHREVEKNE